MSISCTGFYKRLSAFAGMTALMVSQAYAQSPTLPPALLLDGKPIDPLCFESVSADEWLDAKHCVSADIVKLDTEKPAGKIGYNYRYKGDAADASTSYSGYEFIGLWNNSPIILTHTSGGGTGQFTSLMAIEREGGKVRVLQGFAAGDRCNGGVSDVKLEKGTLTYSQWISPFDFLQLAEDNPNDLQAYESLEASAASCYGKARYADGVLTGVTLTGTAENEGKDRADWTEKFAHQSCFNQLYSAYLTQGKKDLSVQQLKEFTGEFNRVCLDEHTNESD